MREIRDYLLDIKNECEYLNNKSRDLNYEDFVKNEELKRAFVRSLEIIGEAARHIPKEIRNKHSQIKWKSIVGIRNKLIHQYFGVDYQVLWKTINLTEFNPEGIVIKLNFFWRNSGRKNYNQRFNNYGGFRS